MSGSLTSTPAAGSLFHGDELGSTDWCLKKIWIVIIFTVNYIWFTYGIWPDRDQQECDARKGFSQHFDSSSPFGQSSKPSHHWEALRHLPLFPQDFPSRHWYHTGRADTGDTALTSLLWPPPPQTLTRVTWSFTSVFNSWIHELKEDLWIVLSVCLRKGCSPEDSLELDDTRQY